MKEDEKLLKQAGEFLDNALFGDDKAASLIYKMKARLKELTADKEPKSIVWEPKKGERYYYVTGDGFSTFTNFSNGDHDLLLLKHHNIYKTRELAEKAAKYQERYNMVLQAVLNLEPDQVVDWSDEDQIKYSINFNHYHDVWCSTGYRGIEYGYPVLTDEKNVPPLLDYLNTVEIK